MEFSYFDGRNERSFWKFFFKDLFSMFYNFIILALKNVKEIKILKSYKKIYKNKQQMKTFDFQKCQNQLRPLICWQIHRNWNLDISDFKTLFNPRKTITPARAELNNS